MKLDMEMEGGKTAMGLQKVLDHMIQYDMLQGHQACKTAHHCLCSLLEVTINLKELLESSETNESNPSSDSEDGDDKYNDDEEEDDSNEVNIGNLCTGINAACREFSIYGFGLSCLAESLPGCHRLLNLRTRMMSQTRNSWSSMLRQLMSYRRMQLKRPKMVRKRMAMKLNLVRKNYSVSCVQPYARTLSDHMECNHCP